jgi:hypothetical protein
MLAAAIESYLLMEDAMRVRVVLCLAVGLLLAADNAKDDDAKKDLKKMEGSWVMVSGELIGSRIGSIGGKSGWKTSSSYPISTYCRRQIGALMNPIGLSWN